MHVEFQEPQIADFYRLYNELGRQAVGFDYVFNVYAYAGRAPMEGSPGEFLMFYRNPDSAFYIGSRNVVVCSLRCEGVDFQVHLLSARRKDAKHVNFVFNENGGTRPLLQPAQLDLLDSVPQNGLASPHKK